MGCTWSDGPYYNGSEYQEGQNRLDKETTKLEKDIANLRTQFEELEKRVNRLERAAYNN